jgi:hypothetical protein
MFGILDILVLILVRRRHCSRCGRTFWAAPPHLGRDTAVGREYYLCVCGNCYETGRREWEHLSRDEKRVYLRSGLLASDSNSSYDFGCHWGIFSKVARALLGNVSHSWSSRFFKRSDMFGVFADHKGTTCPSSPKLCVQGACCGRTVS